MCVFLKYFGLYVNQPIISNPQNILDSWKSPSVHVYVYDFLGVRCNNANSWFF